jgi:hypothetical protein
VNDKEHAMNERFDVLFAGLMRRYGAHVAPEKDAALRALTRREVLGALGAAGAAAIAIGCGDSPTSPSAVSGTTTTTGTNAACVVTPTETIGPFPSLTDLFRSDIREGKSGTQLTLALRVDNVNAGCAAVPNANVEIWHVDAAGDYSQYGTQAAQTFLRGTNPLSNSADGIFADSLSSELVTPTGGVSSGYAATFQVAVSV